VRPAVATELAEELLAERRLREPAVFMGRRTAEEDDDELLD